MIAMSGGLGSGRRAGVVGLAISGGFGSRGRVYDAVPMSGGTDTGGISGVVAPTLSGVFGWRGIPSYFSSSAGTPLTTRMPFSLGLTISLTESTFLTRLTLGG
jgi:hypothetical protein